LLYAANLIAIVLVGAVVFLGSGFVPRARLRRVTRGSGVGLFIVATATAAVAVPLAANSLGNITHAQATQTVNQAVVSWLAPFPGLRASAVDIEGSQVSVDVVGPISPPSSESLATTLIGALGPKAAVRVRWFQTTEGSGSHQKRPTTLTQSELRSAVETWLSSASGNQSTQIVKNTISGDNVTVNLAGPSSPPPAASLAQLMSKQAGQPITVSVSWSMQYLETAQSGATATNGEGQALNVRAVVDRWAASHPGVEIIGTAVVAGIATIDLAGTSAAQVTPDLRQALVTQLGSGTTIVIRFAQLTVLPS
jgi:hypothetical protein